MFTLIKLGMRFTLSWAGVICIALFGLLFVLSGIAGLTQPEETAPTEVPLAEVATAKPEKEWVKVTGGVVYWPEAVTLTETRTSRRGGESKTTEKADYIPLVSPEVRDQWIATAARDGRQAKLDYSGCKVLLVVRPGSTPAGFPTKPTGSAADALTLSYAPEGRIIPASRLDSTVKAEMGKISPGLDLSKVTVVEVGSRPPTHADMGGVIVVGLFLFIPLGLKALLRGKLSGWLYPRPAHEGLIDGIVERAARSARAGFEQGMRRSRRDD